MTAVALQQDPSVHPDVQAILEQTFAPQPEPAPLPPPPAPQAYDPYASLDKEDGTYKPDPEVLRRQSITALYGSDCPLLNDEADKSDWGKWGEALWTRHVASKRKRLHLTQRNRLFREGIQWVSSSRNGPWREPVKHPLSARFSDNMIGPALDQRVQIVAEQRPGFKTRPTTQDPEDIKRAEAQQVAVEYQYDEQAMPTILRETEYHVGTDGSAFWHVYWDADAGPWHEEAAEPHPVTGEPQQGAKYPMGDLRTRVYKIDQVCVSANATCSQKPHYWVLKETIPLAEAVATYGEKAVLSGATHNETADDLFDISGISRLGYEQPGRNELHMEQETVDRFLVFCEPSEYLPKGLMLVSVGCYFIGGGPLQFGVVPMVRITDGSTDPSFFPRPIMEGWLDLQILYNAALTKWIESVRQNAGGRFLAKPRTISQETLIGGLFSTIDVKGPGSISDSVMPLQPFSVGSDTKEIIALAKKRFEDQSGWNDASRGSYSDAASGRAILATREALERIFAEPVNAMAMAMVQWAKICLHGMAFGYDLPRTVGITGHSRADLAQSLQADDFDGVADVEIDPETLMPMPRALRLFLLDQMFEKQVITAQEYRRRLPFAFTRNLETPDEDHTARARRIAEAIKSGQPPAPMLWMDNEALHQDVLEREILLNDKMDPQVQMIANQRWIELANQAAMKQGGMPPGGAPAPAGGGPHQGTSLPPNQQPFLATNPGIAAGPAAQPFHASQNAHLVGADNTKPY